MTLKNWRLFAALFAVAPLLARAQISEGIAAESADEAEEMSEDIQLDPVSGKRMYDDFKVIRAKPKTLDDLEVLRFLSRGKQREPLFSLPNMPSGQRGKCTILLKCGLYFEKELPYFHNDLRRKKPLNPLCILFFHLIYMSRYIDV